MKYYIFSDNHVGISYDDNIPDGAVECDQSVYENAAGYSVVGNSLIPPTAEQLDVIHAAENKAVADDKKESLIAIAKNTISLWQTELLLGSISDSDRALLTAWVNYIKDLNAIDTTAPDITWPEKPAM